MIGLNLDRICNLQNRKAGNLLKQFGQKAFMPGIEVLYQDIGHSGIFWYGFEEIFEGIEPAGRGTHTHNGK